MPSSPTPRPDSAGPPVRVEVRHGSSPPVAFDVRGAEFVVGSVAGCDLRIPGANLPAQVCVLHRTAEAVTLRKVAPALPILLNGSPVSANEAAPLAHGDIVSVGAVDLAILVGQGVEVGETPLHHRAAYAAPLAKPKDFRFEEWERKTRELELRAIDLDEQARDLEADRVAWYERRQEMEVEIRQAKADLDAGRRKEADDRPALLAELRSQVEREVADDYRGRRDELERMQFALREAAVQLREQKAHFEESVKNADPRIRELTQREGELAERLRIADAHAADWRKKVEADEAAGRLREVRLQQREQDLARREVELAARELAVRDLAGTAETDRTQYQADLVRVDRLSAALEAKERALELRAVEVDGRYEQFRVDSRDFEEQLHLFDEREERAKAAEARIESRVAELDARETRLNGRLAEIETQQATLIALRGRLEHLRDELLSQESRVSESRTRTEDEIREASERLRQAESVRDQVEAERSGHEEGLRLFHERSALMAQAVERMRTMQEQVAVEGDRLKALEEELSRQAAEQAEQAAVLRSQSEQLAEAQERVEADRLAIRERDAALRHAEEARESLQDQLRLRAEELLKRHHDADERMAELDAQAKTIAEELDALDELRADAASARRLTDDEKAVLEARDERMREAEETIADQQRQLEESRQRFETEQEEARENLARATAEIEQLKQALSERTAELLNQMPNLEQRAQAALDATAQAREAMRSQLAELHAYALKSQEDLQDVRAEAAEEIDRLREREQSLNRSRSEHRLAVSSFRQQLIEWQGRFSGMKQALHQGETRLDRREREIEATATELADRAEEIRRQEAEVGEKREEVDRHLGDMRQWFRRKFREIAETRWSRHRDAGGSGILPMPARETTSTAVSAGEGVILAMPDDLDPGDRQLGEQLRHLDLIDRDTLVSLWDEARRQRRTLRQVLLSGGYLTLYQLALIESDNLSGLMLGRFRVVDRLRSTTREAVYRVFDPQGEGDATCLLRHLGESEMLDAVRPDEYRMRFAAARDLAHPNVAATREIVDINHRPAVVQEWPVGLPGSDWPAAAASPGVWHRLMMQAALGLQATHSMGLVHGRITAESFVLVRGGTLKLVGVGEPPWLHASGDEATAEDDLRALGQVAAEWMQSGRRKAKPFPPSLLNILRSLGVVLEEGTAAMAVYPSAAALIEDLDVAAASVPADHAAWDKLLSQVEDAPPLRQSA